jgi:Zn-finger nucleic acid-binding protein
MVHLVVCAECRRQLDAGDRRPGERIACPCGATVAVTALLPRDAAVVHCSACGAPRAAAEAACRYCASSFTIHDRDLDTVCPGCMARVSSAARFCHDCGTPILADQAAVSATALRCPACRGDGALGSRRMAGEPVAVGECGRCGGLWVDRGAFEVLVARARHRQLGSLILHGGGAVGAGAGAGGAVAGGVGDGGGGAAGTVGSGVQYRPCAQCGKLMNRQNYGRQSGVILDSCREHGIWFDLDELPRVLTWIQDGGEQRAVRRGSEEAAAEARQRRAAQVAADGSLAASSWGGGGHAGADGEIFDGFWDLLGDGVRRLFHRG